MSNRQIQFKDFESDKLESILQEKLGHVKVANKVVLVVKGKNAYSDGYYEIYSWGILFGDAERFKTMKEVLIRLTELENR